MSFNGNVYVNHIHISLSALHLQTAAELEKRRERFSKELDFVFADVVSKHSLLDFCFDVFSVHVAFYQLEFDLPNEWLYVIGNGFNSRFYACLAPSSYSFTSTPSCS